METGLMAVEDFSLVITTRGKAMVALIYVAVDERFEWNGKDFHNSADHPGWVCVSWHGDGLQQRIIDLAGARVIGHQELIRLDGYELLPGVAESLAFNGVMNEDRQTIDKYKAGK